MTASELDYTDVLTDAASALPELPELPRVKDGRGSSTHRRGPKEYDGDTSKFHNNWREELPPWLQVRKEAVGHRIVAYLKAQGFSNIEIAVRTGYHTSYVSQVTRMPWVQEVIRKQLDESGRNAVNELLKASTYDSVCTLIAVRDDPDTQARDKIAASNSILDRVFGKANQPITHHQVKDLPTLSDAELEAIANANKTANN